MDVTFYTDVEVYGDVGELCIHKNMIVCRAGSNVVCVGNTVRVEEGHSRPETSAYYFKQKCLVSMMRLFVKGKTVINMIDTAAMNNNVLPFTVVLLDGAVFRAGIVSKKVLFKLENASKITCYRKTEQNLLRWIASSVEIRMQPGCSVRGITVIDDVLVVITKNYGSTHAVTELDMIIKPDTRFSVLPRTFPTTGFKVVRESTAPLRTTKRLPDEARQRMETIIARSIPAVESVPVFYMVTYTYNGIEFTTTANPPNVPPGAVVTSVVPMGSSMPDRNVRQRVDDPIPQSVLDESFELAQMNEAGETLNFIDSFDIPEDFKSKYPAFFEIAGNTTAEDVLDTGDDNEKKCVICRDNVPNTVMVPCGHKLCLSCTKAQQYLSDTCPSCRTGISSAIVAF